MRRTQCRLWRILWTTAVMLTFLAAGCLLGTASAAEETPVVRIGFPVQPGISYLDENGRYAGYLVDYLDQLEMFTDWEIEFVQVEGDLDTQLSTLMYMLRDGEIDIMGTMNRNAQLEEMFLYPGYGYGTTYTVLAVQSDDFRWLEEDFSHWNDIRVATYPGYKDRMAQFTYYADVYGFSFVTVECDTYQEMIDAVRSGRADAMIQADLSVTDGFRVIGRFSPTPYYFALAPGETELLRQLDGAMRSLNRSQPNLQNELYDRYFRHASPFQISQEHRDFLASLGTLQVLFFDGNAPYQYIRNGKLQGFAVQYMENFAKITGLQYEAVVADSFEEAMEMISRGEVDVVACLATNSALSSQGGMRFSIPFFNSFSVTACSNSQPHEHPADIAFQANTEATLDQIRRTDSLGSQLDYYSLFYYLRKAVVYDQIIIDWTNLKNFSYVFGVTDAVPECFVTILNQYITSTSDAARQAMIYRYSGEEPTYTAWEWLLANRIMLLSASAIFLILLLILLLTFRSKRMTAKALVAEKQLRHLTMYDGLTGAYNEAYFRELLQECCDRRTQAALVAVNLRDFKYINDIYGPQRANEILCCMKAILDRKMADGEFFCRASADLFYLLLQASDVDTFRTRMENLFTRISTEASGSLEGHPLSLYCGAVFLADSPAHSASANLSYLMVALARAKEQGRNTVYVFDKTLYQEAQLRYYIETHMHEALASEEYQLYLQPRMNLHTGHIDGAEALVRWKPRDHSMLMPNQFIPLFAANGFCAQLDLYMVEQVCRALRSWMDAGLAPMVISVNQTKSLFLREDYAQRLLDITGRYHIPPGYLILEIPEGLAYDNIEALNQTIRRLNGSGFRVSMDDFGSGYSSLNALGKIHINELKLDRIFLADVVNDTSGTQREVLSSVLALARKLGIQTVVEGVETPENEELVRSLACDYGQGYYYSKPIPAEQFRQCFCAMQV